MQNSNRDRFYGKIENEDNISCFLLSETWHGPMEPMKHPDDNEITIENHHINKTKLNFFNIFILTILFFIISLIIFPIYSLGCENNISTLQEDEITQRYLTESCDEEIAKQQEMLDFYSSQRELKDENEKLKEIILKQEIELKELKELKEKENSLKEKEEVIQPQIAVGNDKEEEVIQPQMVPGNDKADDPVAKKVEEVGQKVTRETSRVVHQTNREVKRILKKF